MVAFKDMGVGVWIMIFILFLVGAFIFYNAFIVPVQVIYG